MFSIFYMIGNFVFEKFYKFFMIRSGERFYGFFNIREGVFRNYIKFF